jgi:RecJ-like exonuclease
MAKICPKCGGTGEATIESDEGCPSCPGPGGAGCDCCYYNGMTAGDYDKTVECGLCNGSGKVSDNVELPDRD